MSKLKTLQQVSARSRIIQRDSRAREHRRKVLRLSLMKLHLIEDPEAWLRRSVLIKNTFRSLQQHQSSEPLANTEDKHQPPPQQHVSSDQTFSDVALPPQLDKQSHKQGKRILSFDTCAIVQYQSPGRKRWQLYLIAFKEGQMFC